MKGFERMRERKINHGLHRLASLTLAMLGMVWAANAATGTSEEFRMDLSGMGPWEMRTAAATEAISYSSTWATNTLADAKAVVKVVLDESVGTGFSIRLDGGRVEHDFSESAIVAALAKRLRPDLAKLVNA